MSVIIGFWNEFLPHEKIMILGIFAEMIFLVICIFLKINNLVAISVFIGSMIPFIRYEHKIWLASQQKLQPLNLCLQEKPQTSNN